ncbi:hypothetical protein ACGF07_11520 [Kitasatospora sp. NPDC048194]|uniref:hypothetical protein n=1 Tax=Kitasatospora sp. NPDC048194 TaxID=3364045 RepID=UPI00371533B6
MTATAEGHQGPRSGPRRLGGAIALIALSTALIIGIAALDVYVASFLATLVGFGYPLAMFLALVMRRDADCNPAFQKRQFGWGAAIALLGFAAYVSGVIAWNNLILESGRTVRAVVLSEKVANSLHGTGREYTLASSESNDEVPGGPLSQSSARFKPGDVITVRMDPAGRVPPKLPGEADSPVGMLTFLGCNAVIDGILLWSASRPRSATAEPAAAALDSPGA